MSLALRSLPITLVCGPEASSLARQLARTQKKYRLGILTSPASDWQTGLEKELSAGTLVVYRLASSGSESDVITHRLAQIADEGKVDRLLIECPAVTHPAQLALLLRGSAEEGNVARAHLSRVVMAIAETTVTELADEQWSAPEPPLLIAEQIEFADAIVLTPTSGKDAEELSRQMVAALNPRAMVFQGSSLSIGDQVLERDTPFSFETAFAGLMEASIPKSSKPEVEVMRYVSRSPFHPERFWNFLQDSFPGVFRAKGVFWLASRMETAGGLNLAGQECRHGPAGPWEAVTVLEAKGTQGHRGQSLSFLGMGLDANSLRAQLDRCLLNEREVATGQDRWSSLPDPFPSWREEALQHDCAEHGCSCH